MATLPAFTAILEKGKKYWIAYCAEIPEANGQGTTKEEAIQSLKDAILLVLEDRREERLKWVPPDAICEKLPFA